MMPPKLNPNEVRISAHAKQRYRDRRNTRPGACDTGIRRLLRQAALKPTPPLRFVGQHPPHRTMLVGGFVLIFDSEMTTLVTMWRCR